MSETAQALPMPAFLRSRAIRPLLITVLVIYFIFSMISLAPAKIAGWAINASMPNVWLTSVRGTLWNGVAGGAQFQIGEQSIALGSVRWTLNPMTLLTLQPCISFEVDSGGQPMSGLVCQSPFGITRLKDLNMDLPLSVLESVLPVRATGDLSIQIIEASITGQRVDELDARVTWQNASVFNGESWWSLGTFGGQAKHNNEGGIAVRIFDVSGPVGVDVNAAFALGSELFTLSGNITPRSEAPEQMKQGLQMIGEEVEPGTYKVSWP
ncbi:MAG: type II secretion system protein N [Agarilytica sp.]